VAHGFKVINRDQQFLLAPDVREWLPEDHLAWLVIETVEQLDLSPIEATYRLGGVGRQPYHPALLVALLLYAYAIGQRSSRTIERACHSDVAFRVIAANQRPDHATIARFRAEHRQALESLHAQVLAVCAAAGLVDARLVAVDSTKLAANASASANLTRAQLQEAAAAALDEAEQVDRDEDEQFGVDSRGDEPAPGWEPGNRRSRIRAALEAANGQSSEQDQIAARQAARIAAGHKPKGRKRLPADPSKPKRINSRKARTAPKGNVTDPDSRMMKAPRGYVQGYSAQAVATRQQIILAGAVTNDQNDNRALLPMLETARSVLETAGIAPDSLRAVLADRGYWNAREIDTIEDKLKITTLVATVKDRDLRSKHPPPQPDRPARQRMHQRFDHPSARRFYKRRSTMIEPIFGQRKTNRRLDRFLGRGLEAVNAEWTLEIIAHNLTKLHRHRLAATPG
jgi:transposase